MSSNDYVEETQRGRYILISIGERARVDKLVGVPSNYLGDIFRINQSNINRMRERALERVEEIEDLEEFK